ncbi:hypothetical protein BR93DRAFT_135050 [Coniochaeta sp. PMI_546]|nr:hypothetical protein BR93DRAFT_135050 [Coniochaeta sp. PMI_546]
MQSMSTEALSHTYSSRRAIAYDIRCSTRSHLEPIRQKRRCGFHICPKNNATTCLPTFAILLIACHHGKLLKRLLSCHCWNSPHIH